MGSAVFGLKDADMKKLLFIGSYPPPYGGVASHLNELAPQLIKKGYKIVIISPSSVDHQADTEGLKVIYFNLKGYFYKNIFSIIAAFIGALKYKADINTKDYIKQIAFAHKISKVINGEGIRAVFIYENYNGLVIPVLKKHYKILTPLVFMILGEFYLYPDKYKAMSKYMRSVFDNSEVILSSSHYCASSISKVLNYDFPVKVIYVGIDHQLYVPTKDKELIRGKLGIPENALVFLFLGRMLKDMGVDFLLRNAMRLFSINPNNYLVLAGAPGELSGQVKELSDREPRVKYCPNIPYDEKPYYFAASDVLLAPTMEKQACMGVAIKEAMSCGKPILASTSGGISEAIVDGENGYLVPFVNGELNVDMFIEKANKLSNDSILRKKMGESGRSKAVNVFSNDLTVKRYLEVLDGLGLSIN